MNKLRWVTEGDVWDLDMSTPATLEATARPVPGDPLPLGLSRGTRLTRPKQIDFFHRFMATPLLSSYFPLHSDAGDGGISGGGGGLSLHRVLTVPFSNNWFVTLLGQFDVQKFVSAVKRSGGADRGSSPASRLNTIGKNLRDKSLYALGFCLEFLLTPNDTLLLSYDTYGGALATNPRAKAVFHHKFPMHNLTVEAVSPSLFVDKCGEYWDVPFLMALDLASLPSQSGLSYHFCLLRNSGLPKKFDGNETSQVPDTLLPGLSLKTAFSYRMNMDVWRSNARKLKMVQPYDIFLSNPHVSVSGTIGVAMTASFGENSIRSNSQDFGGLSLHVPSVKSGCLADAFARVSLTAQHGNFQRLFSDLTRFHARLDFPSGIRFLSGAASVTQDLLNSQQPGFEALQKICPEASVSLQQQIIGPFSFRFDSGVVIDLKNKATPLRVDNPVFALEYALQVLGSAKAVAWYAPKHTEFMVELRLFET